MPNANRETKPLKDKKEVIQVLVVPQELTNKRELMFWLLEALGKKYNKISCAKALEKLQIEDTLQNRKYWYDRKSEYKHSLTKRDRDSKYQKPSVSYHNFNEASVFLDGKFSLGKMKCALDSGWVPTNSKNRHIMWKEKRGWLKWFVTTGRVRLHVRKPVTDGKIMQLLANGFFNTKIFVDIKEFTAFFRSFFLKAVKLSVDLGEASKIPRFNLEFDNGYCKLVVMNDDSHPHGIEIQYYLLKEGEQVRQYLKDSKRTLDYSADTNIQLTQVLSQLLTPKPLRDSSKRMVV